VETVREDKTGIRLKHWDFDMQTANELKLPWMRMVRQRFKPGDMDVLERVDQEWNAILRRLPLSPEADVAVAVGSRGIGDLTLVVGAVVSKLKEAGCRPFITPAMGSHGGAMAEGQVEVLAAKGITEAKVGAPVRATMDVVRVGEVDGIPLFLDRLAHEAAGIVLINRIKPHTDFTGGIESGLFKMLVIGLGNRTGAEYCHRLSVVRDMAEVLQVAGRALLKKTKVLFGVALVEDPFGRTAELKMALAEDIEATEKRSLERARQCLPTLPLDAIDILVVDEIGKDISGTGMDPNVVGRPACRRGFGQTRPDITRIIVRDLTEATKGHASGIGMADFTIERLVAKIDFRTTRINALASCCPEDSRIPLTFANDRDALAAALLTIRPCREEDLRLVCIKNTKDLETLLVSEGCLPALREKDGMVIEKRERLQFDLQGNLISAL
jgi:hypothetical protein